MAQPNELCKFHVHLFGHLQKSTSEFKACHKIAQDIFFHNNRRNCACLFNLVKMQPSTTNNALASESFKEYSQAHAAKQYIEEHSDLANATRTPNASDKN